MLLRFLFVLLAAITVAASTPYAQSARKPYEALAVAYDGSLANDPALKQLIEKLHIAVAEKKLAVIDAALGASFAVIECDADPTKPCSPTAKGAVRSNAKLPPPARIRQALCCRDIAPAKISKALREETVLGLVGAALEEETLGAHPLIVGAACLPAWPAFDMAKAGLVASAADIEKDNLRVTNIDIILQEKPSADAPEIARLPKGQMAPLVTDLAQSLPDGWSAIALPQGGLGYTRQLGLNEIAPGGICFQKDIAGQWQITLSILRRS